MPALKAVVAIRGKLDVEARRNSCLSITQPQASTPTRITLAVAAARSAVKRHFWAVALVLGLLFLGETVFAHSTLKLKSFGC